LPPGPVVQSPALATAPVDELRTRRKGQPWEGPEFGAAPGRKLPLFLGGEPLVLDTTVGVRLGPVHAVHREVFRAVALRVLAVAALERAIPRAHLLFARRRGGDRPRRRVAVIFFDAALVCGARDFGHVHAEALHLDLVRRALVRAAL